MRHWSQLCGAVQTRALQMCKKNCEPVGFVLDAPAPTISVAALRGRLRRLLTGPSLLDFRWILVGPPGTPPRTRRATSPGRASPTSTASRRPAGAGPGRHPSPAPRISRAAMPSIGVDATDRGRVRRRGRPHRGARWWLSVRRPRRRARPRRRHRRRGRRGHALSAEEPAVAPGRLHPHAGGMPILEAARRRAGPAGVLLDARARDRYGGESEPVDPAPGTSPARAAPPPPRTSPADGPMLPPDTLANASPTRRTRRAAISPRTAAGAHRRHDRLALARRRQRRHESTRARGASGRATRPAPSRPPEPARTDGPAPSITRPRR